MHRLIHNKHLPGLTRKHQTRIESKLDHYRMINNDTIQIKRDNIWKTIPFKEDRQLIIERAHLLDILLQTRLIIEFQKNTIGKTCSHK